MTARTDRPVQEDASNPHVAVVGGGLAGLAAAVALAERGLRVTVLEREPYLGGRAGAWDDRLADGTPFQMERGFHAFFRQYYNLRALMRRVDPTLSVLRRLDDYPILGPGGAVERFRKLPRRAPWNVAEVVRRTPTLGWSDLARVSVPRAAAMIAFDPVRTRARWDHTSAAAYLDSLGFPPRARRMLFDVFAHSFFSAEEDYSAAELLEQFHFYFCGNPEGLVFDVMRSPFSTGLFAPLGRYLEARGAEVRVSSAVEQILPGPDRIRVEGTHAPIDADAVVLATTVPALRDLLERSPDLGSPEWRSRVAGLPVARPFAVWRLWLDRRVRPDRAPFIGTTGAGPLDNITLYDRLEDEARAWTHATGGSVVELHAYAVAPGTDEGTLRRELLAGLHAFYPETASARVREERFLMRQDCPAFPPGSAALRPTVDTPDPRILLAGDFVRLPFPSALMERAVSSGLIAANRVLGRLGRSLEPVRHVPVRGLLAWPAWMPWRNGPAQLLSRS